MKIEPLAISGAYLICAEEVRDQRGYFARTFSEDAFRQAGLATHFLEHSIAQNVTAGTVRGMHYSVYPAQEHKLVRCERGAIIDVLLDVRQESDTYGASVAVQLSEAQANAVYIPAGCAHGYQTLVDDTVVSYLISDRYAPDLSRGFSIYSDSVNKFWPVPIACISERDVKFEKFSPSRGK